MIIKIKPLIKCRYQTVGCSKDQVDSGEVSEETQEEVSEETQPEEDSVEASTLEIKVSHLPEVS